MRATVGAILVLMVAGVRRERIGNIYILRIPRNRVLLTRQIFYTWVTARSLVEAS